MSTSDDKMDAALAALDNWYDSALQSGMGFKSDGERQDYLKSLGDPEKHPMFAQTTEDLEGNPLVEALRAIKEEDKTNVELAIMYKDEGNEWIKKNDKKSYNEANDRYTHALGFIEKAKKEEKEEQLNQRTENGEATSDLETEILKRKQLESQIYSNRAQVHLYLQNYGSCKKDCDAAIQCNPDNIKAYFRKAKALFALKDYISCQLVCQTGLTIETTHKELAQLLIKAEEELEKKNAKQDIIFQNVYNEKIVSFQQVFLLAQQLGCGLSNFSITYPEPIQFNNLWPTCPTIKAISPARLNTMYAMKTLPKRVLDLPKDEITWPILLLYPQYNQLDIISEASYTTMLAEYLVWLFPEHEDQQQQQAIADAPQPIAWDVKKEYYASNLVVYLQYEAQNTTTATAAAATTRKITNKIDWLINCFEYALFLNQITLGMFVYALNKLFLQANATIVSTTKSNYLTEYEAYLPFETSLTNEIVFALAKQREQILVDTNNNQPQGKNKNVTRKVMEVHVGCTIEKIVTFRPDEHLLPRGTLSLIVFPKSSASHTQFLKQAKEEENITIEMLNP